MRGGLRALHIAERPATEDGFLRAQATTSIDLFAAYRWRSLELSVTIENLINRRYKAAQFATVTRLPGEAPVDAPAPPGACPAGTRPATSTQASTVGCSCLRDWARSCPRVTRRRVSAAGTWSSPHS
jgi:hypothetical protein